MIMQDTILQCKAKRNFKKIYNELKTTRILTTKMLKYFNISLDSFLRYCQRDDKTCNEIIDKLLKMFE